MAVQQNKPQNERVTDAAPHLARTDAGASPLPKLREVAATRRSLTDDAQNLRTTEQTSANEPAISEPLPARDLSYAGLRDLLLQEIEKSPNARLRAIADKLGLLQNPAHTPTALLVSNHPGLPQVAPSIWADRKSGREVTPADFIRNHYGKWIGKGLQRADLKRLDLSLYNAYVAQIRRHPDQSISELTYQKRSTIVSPEEALEKQRAAQRRYYHRKNSH